MSARGSRREHQVAATLRSASWVVYRSSGSHGNADLIALRAGETLLVQVKSSKHPWEHFRRAERLALAHEAIAAGATAKLVHWPAHGKPRWYDVDEWPDTPGIPAQAPLSMDRHLEVVS